MGPAELSWLERAVSALDGTGLSGADRMDAAGRDPARPPGRHDDAGDLAQAQRVVADHQQAVDSVWPEPRKKLPPRATALGPCKAVVDGILWADLDAPRKQRHTVTRIFHRLVEEHGAEVSYQLVRRYVADRKPQILVESESLYPRGT
ncbi:hypothetical protein [Streptomyces sp. 3214.6]|uniref:hypothetical protein n=1 Tax=Streptomyces sp. 3214.6 TaxID=1882757 RepID=UPI001E2D98A6|nr:hypothetical protein [Streptomyces sp. 3214.6]